MKNQQLTQTKRTLRGFNLIEAAIVLGVVGLVIGGIWVAAAAVQSNLREADASKGLLADYPERAQPLLRPNADGDNGHGHYNLAHQRQRHSGRLYRRGHVGKEPL